jgi:hypothetical protein
MHLNHCSLLDRQNFMPDSKPSEARENRKSCSEEQETQGSMGLILFAQDTWGRINLDAIALRALS